MEVEELLQKCFDKFLVVFHNAKFDIKMLEYHFNFKFPRWACSMIMHYILNENEPHDLKYIAMKYCKMGDYESALEVWKQNYCRKHKIGIKNFTYDLVPYEILQPYACKDTDATLRAYNLFQGVIGRSKGFTSLLDNFLFPANRFLMDIETFGVPFAQKELLKVQNALDFELTELKSNVYKYKEIEKVEEDLKVIFNPNSTAHLRNLLFKQLKLPVTKKTATGAASTDAEVLEYLAKKHHIADYILKIRKLQKLKSTYIDKILLNLDNDSFLRTNFNLTVATSGRLSSSGKLNMQQLPRDDKRVKSCISMKEIDSNYCIWSQDLKTAEMYYAAVLSQDKNLMNIFRQGTDFHSTIAHTVFGLPCSVEEVEIHYKHLRQAAKAVSFGILYGAGPYKVAETSGISIEEAKQVISQYFATFPDLKKWLLRTQLEIAENGFIYSVFNRKRRVPNVFSISEEEKGHAIRSALNFTVQSVASDINLMAAIDLHNWLQETKIGNIFALVHDSILGICKKSEIETLREQAKITTAKDRGGIIIPGCPIGVDFEYGESYAFTD
jgi:DNA polymerase I-like protein with 3'-5' exonuclease and polymerase domains